MPSARTHRHTGQVQVVALAVHHHVGLDRRHKLAACGGVAGQQGGRSFKESVAMQPLCDGPQTRNEGSC